MRDSWNMELFKKASILKNENPIIHLSHETQFNMKKHRHKPLLEITNPEIQDYAEAVTTPESEAIQQLVQSSDAELEYVDMLSGNLVGQLLKLLIKISGAKRILEIGTFTGYSALTMAEALPEDGKIITLEMNLRYQELAEKHFEDSVHKNKIILKKGSALELLEEIDGTFDLIFLDADKVRYPVYYKKLLPKLRSGGLLVADNVLWDGMVLKPEDEKSKAIDEFNRIVADDYRVEQVLLPVRDGISIIRKK